MMGRRFKVKSKKCPPKKEELSCRKWALTITIPLRPVTYVSGFFVSELRSGIPNFSK
jgi:hypothetical protein